MPPRYVSKVEELSTLWDSGAEHVGKISSHHGVTIFSAPCQENDLPSVSIDKSGQMVWYLVNESKRPRSITLDCVFQEKRCSFSADEQGQRGRRLVRTRDVDRLSSDKAMFFPTVATSAAFEVNKDGIERAETGVGISDIKKALACGFYANARITPPKPTRGEAKILFISAAVAGEEQLRAGRELREIEESLKGSNSEVDFVVVHCTAARTRDLVFRINEEAPDILHFCVHGDPGVGVSLESMTEDGDIPLDNLDLAGLLKTLTHKVSLVVLAACYSAQDLFALTPPADFAIGMTGDVSDAAATEFAVVLYRLLADGSSLGRAFETAKQVLNIETGGRPRENEIVRLQVHPGIDPHGRRFGTAK